MSLGKLLKETLSQSTPEQLAAQEEMRRERSSRSRKERDFWEAYWASDEGKLLKELREKYPQFTIDKFFTEEEIFG